MPTRDALHGDRSADPRGCYSASYDREDTGSLRRPGREPGPGRDGCDVR
jgi:hypothetical protein